MRMGFGKYILSPPDPQAIWLPTLAENDWQNADAIFTDQWVVKNKIPDSWDVNYKKSNCFSKTLAF